MSDYGDLCRELRDAKREHRAKFGALCPECKRVRPKAHPSILLPQQRCKVDGYRARHGATGATMNEQKQPAVAGPVEPTVRPRVWMVRRHDAPNYWIPFLHEPVDALKDPEREVVPLHWPEDIAAEREKCAALMEQAIDLTGLNSRPDWQQYTAKLLTACAALIRAA